MNEFFIAMINIDIDENLMTLKNVFKDLTDHVLGRLLALEEDDF